MRKAASERRQYAGFAGGDDDDVDGKGRRAAATGGISRRVKLVVLVAVVVGVIWFLAADGGGTDTVAPKKGDTIALGEDGAPAVVVPADGDTSAVNLAEARKKRRKKKKKTTTTAEPETSDPARIERAPDVAAQPPLRPVVPVAAKRTRRPTTGAAVTTKRASPVAALRQHMRERAAARATRETPTVAPERESGTTETTTTTTTMTTTTTTTTTTPTTTTSSTSTTSTSSTTTPARTTEAPTTEAPTEARRLETVEAARSAAVAGASPAQSSSADAPTGEPDLSAFQIRPKKKKAFLLDILKLNGDDPLLRRRDPLAPASPPLQAPPLAEQWVEREAAPAVERHPSATMEPLPIPKPAPAPAPAGSEAERRKRADDERRVKAKEAEVEAMKAKLLEQLARQQRASQDALDKQLVAGAADARRRELESRRKAAGFEDDIYKEMSAFHDWRMKVKAPAPRLDQRDERADGRSTPLQVVDLSPRAPRSSDTSASDKALKDFLSFQLNSEREKMAAQRNVRVTQEVRVTRPPPDEAALIAAAQAALAVREQQARRQKQFEDQEMAERLEQQREALRLKADEMKRRHESAGQVYDKAVEARIHAGARARMPQPVPMRQADASGTSDAS